MSRIFVEIFVSEYCKTLHGNPSEVCFGKFLVAKKFMDKKGRGILGFSVARFLFHSAEKCRRATLQGVTNFGESKIFMLHRVMSRYFSEFFVSQYRKTLQGNPSVLCFGTFPVANKFMDKKGGNAKTFRRKFFVSQCRKTSQGNHFECH